MPLLYTKWQFWSFRLLILVLVLSLSCLCCGGIGVVFLTVSFEDMLGEGGATLQPSSTLNTLPKAEPEVIQCDSSSSEDEKDTEGCVPDIDTVQEKREDERTNESSEEPDEKTNSKLWLLFLLICSAAKAL